VDEYASERPLLDLREYFNGTVDAWGVFTDRNGKVVKRFTVVMNCQWQGDSGVLDEDFVYADGTRDKRIWRLQHLGNGAYSGTAGDVVGTAQGQTRGNSFRWGYTLALPVDAAVACQRRAIVAQEVGSLAALASSTTFSVIGRRELTSFPAVVVTS
jgi:hypothetical protein